jgi:centromere-localized protein 2
MPPQPPAESEILGSYLLRPAPLTAITTYERFRSLFPRALQQSEAAEPRLRSLWRDLQAQRGLVVDEVSAGVAAEAKRGVAMRREIVRARMEAEGEGDVADGEVEMERAVSLAFFSRNNA